MCGCVWASVHARVHLWCGVSVCTVGLDEKAQTPLMAPKEKYVVKILCAKIIYLRMSFTILLMGVSATVYSLISYSESNGHTCEVSHFAFFVSKPPLSLCCLFVPTPKSGKKQDMKITFDSLLLAIVCSKLCKANG